ncbi:MAG: hypothetical protein H0T76_10015 [Nannocystis sp.]|nr:hypothetical protein [Nannocystis sp.]
MAALALATACADDPSFVLRWQVGRSAAEADRELRSVRQCSELGLSFVRVVTLSDDGTEVDRREFPCFPDEFKEADGGAPGPELAAGDYFVNVLGLTRRQLTRPDPNPEDPNEQNPVLARDSIKVTVRTKGEGTLVRGIHLIGADECADGVDNDRDGAVDMADSPCRDGQVYEDLDLSGALFTFEATLLGGDNPRATCNGLGLASFRVSLDGDLAGARTIPCTTTVQSFSADLAPGEHSWVVEGLDRDGVAVTEPLTDPLTAKFTIAETGFTLVPIVVDFSIASFLAEPAFSGPLLFSIQYLPYPDAPLTRPCDPVGLNLGNLVLGTTRVTLLGDDQVADQITLDELPFPVEDVCTEFDRVRTTSDLVWDSVEGATSYSAQVETWAADDDGNGPCFSNVGAPELLAPNISVALTVPRVRTDGVCADCTSNMQCARCESGVCLR